MVHGRVDVVVKFSELPDATKDVDGRMIFSVFAAGRVVSIAVKAKVWAKLVQAAKDWPSWVAAVGGKMGAPTARGFVLDEPGLQVFEKKPPKVEAASSAALTPELEAPTG